MSREQRRPVSSVVVISDTHAGCRLGLCPPHGAQLDDGGVYMPSAVQVKLWTMWREFWEEWVPIATGGEPFAVVHNGDAIDGVHHNSTTQISHNLTDQRRIAADVLRPVVEACEGRYYHVRGTEAHVGKSAQDEEALAETLGAIPSETGHARYDLRLRLVEKKTEAFGHFLHHIGSTGSQAYEATAVHKELVESFAETARWQKRVPDFIVRSHRHRYISTDIATANGHAFAVVTPGWQGKTPFAWKIPGARLSEPQFGGVVVRIHKGELYHRPRVWTLEPSRVEG